MNPSDRPKVPQHRPGRSSAPAPAPAGPPRIFRPPNAPEKGPVGPGAHVIAALHLTRGWTIFGALVLLYPAVMCAVEGFDFLQRSRYASDLPARPSYESEFAGVSYRVYAICGILLFLISLGLLASIFAWLNYSMAIIRLERQRRAENLEAVLVRQRNGWVILGAVALTFFALLAYGIFSDLSAASQNHPERTPEPYTLDESE